MTDTKAKVVGINGNMITIEFDGNVSMNEVGYVNVDGKKLRGEVIRIRGNKAQSSSEYKLLHNGFVSVICFSFVDQNGIVLCVVCVDRTRWHGADSGGSRQNR